MSSNKSPQITKHRRHGKASSSLTESFAGTIRAHKQEAASSARRILDGGSTSLLTALVIAIALALPTSLHLLLNNVDTVLANWDQQNNVSVFLEPNLTEAKIAELQSELKKIPEVTALQFISAEQALTDFQENSGLSDIVASLDENPLPATIVVQSNLVEATSLEAFRASLLTMRGVESVSVDTAWISRLNAMLLLGDRFVMALGFSLAFAVLLVIFNTIRLAIANQAQEILITKLMGATDSFVRRPFLYSGAWLGLAGGVIGLILAELLVIFLQDPVGQLADLYQSGFSLQGVTLSELVYVPCIGFLAGILGSYVAVSKHLRTLDPI